MIHEVRVGPLPVWLDTERLLGGVWALEDGPAGRFAVASRGTADAADVAARLRGLGFGGRAVTVDVAPPLKRPAIRAARTEDARRRRDTTPGFLRPGVRLDDEGRMSLTPEVLAVRLAERVAGLSVVDAGCGSGGQAIAFARAGCRVIAIDRDPARLADARLNARVYGVEGRVEWVVGDAVEVARARTADVLHVDPPWGAEWDRVRTTVDDLPLLGAILGVFRGGGYGRLLAKVPPSFDPDTLPGAVPEAFFGEAPGDRRRVKFVGLALGR